MGNMRKWEDMPEDCLVNIFGRLSLESRLLGVPLVCKPWLRAVRNPLCWQTLIFPACISGSYQYNRGSGRNKLIPFVVDLGQRVATSISFPSTCSIEELIYISEECPALKKLVLPVFVCNAYSDIIPSLIEKWKNLEYLSLGSISGVLTTEIIKRFGSCITSGYIKEDMASAIVKLPKLKQLIINKARLQKEHLLLMMQGCRELVHLDVRNCIGFDEDDEEIIKLSSVIKNFQCDGSNSKTEEAIYYDSLFDKYRRL